MPKKQFRSLKDLEKFVQQKVEKTIKGSYVDSVFKEAMQEKVITVVYEHYSPIVYERRGGDGGLSDKDNMAFTSHIKNGKQLVSLFENLAVGNSEPIYDLPKDTMNGYFISNLIENGSQNIHDTHSNSTNGWRTLTHLDGSKGEWTDPRPFAQETAIELNNPSYFNSVLKSVLEHGINT